MPRWGSFATAPAALSLTAKEVISRAMAPAAPSLVKRERRSRCSPTAVGRGSPENPHTPPSTHPLPHLSNFVAAVRSRKAGDLAAEALQGHLSAACCHMANISHRLGKQSSPEAI